MASAGATSMRALTMEFKALEREPVEGFLVTIPDENDFYTWQVAIFGPPETPYEGGYFKVCTVSPCPRHAYACGGGGGGGGVCVCVCVCVLATHPIHTSMNMSSTSSQAEVKFPIDYPYSPPRLRFLTPILHPNVYQVG